MKGKGRSKSKEFKVAGIYKLTENDKEQVRIKAAEIVAIEAANTEQQSQKDKGAGEKGNDNDKEEDKKRDASPSPCTEGSAAVKPHSVDFSRSGDSSDDYEDWEKDYWKTMEEEKAKAVASAAALKKAAEASAK